MNKGKKNIKLNMLRDLVLEKKISRKMVPRVLKEIAMGSIPTAELLTLLSKKN